MTSPRASAVRELLNHIDRLAVVGQMTWSLESPNFLGLAINCVLRRQREALGAAVSLGESGQGHMAVSFVRLALDERLWLGYLCSLERSKANELLLAMGRHDTRRSLKAQRDFIGEEALTSLWYPPGFVDMQVQALTEDETDLKSLGKELGWGNRVFPSTRWLAEQIDEVAEYEYLHSATSRAVHFSVGEVMRRAWGTPGGEMTTDKPEFKEHLSEFALDQLWRLWFSTLGAVRHRLDGAGVSSDPTLDLEPEEIVGKLTGMGRVPLVHAAEWNLTPEGPLPKPTRGTGPLPGG